MVVNVGSRVRELRIQAGLSGNQLAKIAGIAQTSVSAVELGKAAPTTDLLSRICAALGITLAEFFADDIESIPVDVKRLVNVAQNMTTEERSLLTSFLTMITGHQRKEIPIKNMKENSNNLSNNIIPSVEQVAAHLEGEYGIYDEALAEHLLNKIKLAQAEYDGEKRKKDKRG